MVADTPLIMLLFENAADPERRIAGMSAAGRMAAEACEIDAREILIAAPAAPALSAALRDDIRRACGDVRVRAVAIADIGDQDSEALVLKGSHLVPAASAAWRVIRATGKAGDGLVSRWLNRPVSQFLSSMVLHLPGIRPWHMTAVVGLVALAMFACFVSGTAGGIVAGGLLFHAASVLDGVDGEVARATFRSSAAGAILDTAVDMATNFLFYIGLTIGLARLHGEIHLWVGGWTILCALAGLLILSWLIRRIGHSGSFDILKLYYRHTFPRGFPRLITEMLVAMTSRDFFAFAFAVVIVAGGAAAVSWILAGFATLWIFLVLAAAPGLCSGADGPWRKQSPA